MAPRLKILHVITRLVHGGAQLNTLMCCLDQAHRGHDVTLVTGIETGPEGSLLERARRAPIRLIEMPELVRRISPAHDLKALLHLTRILGQHYDIVHTHTSKAGLLGRWAAWLRRAPVVIHTPHGHVFHGYFHPAKERLFVWMERLTALITHRFVMLTEGELRDHRVERIGSLAQFLVVPSGIDLTRFAPGASDRESLGLPLERRLVGTVLRLVTVKGIFDLLDAFRLVLQREPAAHLAIAGDGPQREEVETRIHQCGLRHAVTLLGRTDAVAPLLRSLDVFVLPSHNEGMGRAVVEAMASGLPVVATRVGGLPDLVEHGQTGYLIPPRAPTQLAESILRMLQEPEKAREMGKLAIERAGQFTDRIMYDRLEELYQSFYQNPARQ